MDRNSVAVISADIVVLVKIVVTYMLAETGDKLEGILIKVALLTFLTMETIMETIMGIMEVGQFMGIMEETWDVVIMVHNNNIIVINNIMGSKIIRVQQGMTTGPITQLMGLLVLVQLRNSPVTLLLQLLAAHQAMTADLPGQAHLLRSNTRNPLRSQVQLCTLMLARMVNRHPSHKLLAM